MSDHDDWDEMLEGLRASTASLAEAGRSLRLFNGKIGPPPPHTPVDRVPAEQIWEEVRVKQAENDRRELELIAEHEGLTS